MKEITEKVKRRKKNVVIAEDCRSCKQEVEKRSKEGKEKNGRRGKMRGSEGGREGGKREEKKKENGEEEW